MSGTMPTITLDHNCIIALERNEAASEHVRVLIDAHNAGKVEMRVVAVGGAEKTTEGTYPDDFREFLVRLIPIGLANVEILKPLGYCGMAFCGQCVVGGGDASALERKIQDALFPHFDFDVPSAKQRNNRCDVLTMWCHIRYGGDIFVTTDSDFHQATMKQRLIALGAGSIMHPDEAVQALKAAEAVDSSEAQ